MIIDRGTQSSELWYEPGPGDSPEGRTGQWIVQSLRFSKSSCPTLIYKLFLIRLVFLFCMAVGFTWCFLSVPPHFQ